MKDWQKYWKEYPKLLSENEFFAQVGKTTNRVPISEHAFHQIINDIILHLEVENSDLVLDMCCGNGIITKEISKYCKSIVGVDFSSSLIEIARKYNNPNNATYYCADIRTTGKILHGQLSKMYMYEALQHFTYQEFKCLLVYVDKIAAADLRFFLGSVPDQEKKWMFYNTPKRKFDYFLRKLKNDEAIGMWWTRDLIKTVCDELHLKVKFFDQHPVLHTAHYRFDILITR